MKKDTKKALYSIGALIVAVGVTWLFSLTIVGENSQRAAVNTIKDTSADNLQLKSLGPCVPSATTVCGKLTIVKNTVPDSYQDFNFSNNVPGYFSFPLDDDATLANPSSMLNYKTMNTPANGNFYVNEPTAPGYTVVVTCNDPSGGTTITGTVANISMSNAEAIVCTYMNTQAFQPQACTSNTWTQKADFGGAIRNRAVGFSIGTKGYIGTGNGGVGAQSYQDLWEYNPTTNTWTQKANIPTTNGRRDAVGFSIGNKGYIGTGNALGVLLSDFWEYDPVINSWLQKANVPGPTRTQAVGFSIGTKGYVGTGYGPYQNLQDFYEYTPGPGVMGGTWTQKANFGGGVRHEAVGFSIGTKGYVGTGTTEVFFGEGPFYQDFWEYDPVTDVWTQKANFGGGPRSLAVGFSMSNKGYIGTGFTNNNDNYINYQDFYEYTPGPGVMGGNWTPKANFGGGVREQAVGLSIGARGYIGTGTLNNTSPFSKKDFWEYCP